MILRMVTIRIGGKKLSILLKRVGAQSSDIF
ncbi:protein of unknown function [Candidatus Nitrosotalea okcheonensis]|uniref:Uncharacterized protein n=1 Tax=Candidatus Nitrosotalea okcheonensis TaxID=1903276 RepID=A0A2H1FEZ1_9ARCH|nr:protein of unknown function [Candidatus Nitrosotalea okcheonensis]